MKTYDAFRIIIMAAKLNKAYLNNGLVKETTGVHGLDFNVKCSIFSSHSVTPDLACVIINSKFFHWLIHKTIDKHFIWS